MPVDIKFIHPKDFLKTTATGDLDLAASRKLLLEIVSLMKRAGEFQVLIDLRQAEPRLSASDIFELGVSMASEPAMRQSKIALLSPMKDEEKAHFMETVSRNRGAQLRAFKDYEQAITWLIMVEQK
jgi:hypothetical protein